MDSVKTTLIVVYLLLTIAVGLYTIDKINNTDWIGNKIVSK